MAQTPLGELLKAGLGDRRCAELRQWFEDQRQTRSFVLPLQPDDIANELMAQALRCLCADIQEWQAAAGIIVVVLTAPHRDIASVVGLPYVLDSTAGRHDAIVRDANDRPLRVDMQSGVLQGNRAARHYRYLGENQHASIILTTQTGGVDVPLKGGSAGLSVLISHALRSAGVAGGPFDWAASGCLSPGGHISMDAMEGRTRQRKVEYLRALGIRHIIVPRCGANLAGVQCWPSGTGLKPLIERLVLALSGRDCGESTLASVEHDLRSIDRGMRHGSLPAGSAKRMLGAYLKRLGARKDVRAHRLSLDATMLMASAECHLGNFQQSQVICRQVQQTWRSLGLRSLADLLIRQAVNLTDATAYGDAVVLCDKALGLLNDGMDDLERWDRELQIAGTKGQALTYWSLQNGSKARPAIQQLRKAINLARRLDAPEDVDRDLPRELNYRCLWHALLDRRGFASAYAEAAQEQKPTGASHDYLLRIRWLAAYRAMLAGDSFPWREFEDELPRSAQASGNWLLATSLKYRGALRAAAGAERDAFVDFQKACNLLKDQKGNLLAFIGATTALQAWGSLRYWNQSASLPFLISAKRTLRPFRTWFRGAVAGERWLEWARRCRKQSAISWKTEANPQRYYPY